MVELYSIVYLCTISSIHFSVDGHLGCSPLLAIVNSAAMNIGVRGSFQIVFFLDICPGVGWQGPMTALFLVF